MAPGETYNVSERVATKPGDSTDLSVRHLELSFSGEETVGPWVAVSVSVFRFSPFSAGRGICFSV